MAASLFSSKSTLCQRFIQTAKNELTCHFLKLNAVSYLQMKAFLHTRTSASTSFGLMFDIDGVLVRGKQVLPPAVQAFKKLTDATGKFKVPAIFVTNAGNGLRCEKAKFLSERLEVEISENQVVMAHSPLRMFRQFHSKTVLVSGQGPITEIAKNLGFTNVVTIEDIREAFPVLDAVDQKRRKVLEHKIDHGFLTIEAIVLFGEPVNWETSLQLLLDVLMTNGRLTTAPKQLTYPHLPVLACNMDLQWMAEAWLPRFGHGAFLVCLEELYKKVTGRELIYTALIGKPSELTFHHAEHVAQQHAKDIGLQQPIKRLYFVGDNPNTDIFGANLYNRYLKRNRVAAVKQPRTSAMAVSISQLGSPDFIKPAEVLEPELEVLAEGAEECYSILVKTGVAMHGSDSGFMVEHSPRDFLPVEDGIREAAFVVEDVHHAVELVFRKENFT